MTIVEREYEAKPASQAKAVARALLDTDDWMTTSEIANEAAVEGNNAVNAYLKNLRERGLIESEPTEGREHRHRVIDEQRMLVYLDGAVKETPEQKAERLTRGRTSAEARRRVDAALTSAPAPRIGSIGEMLSAGETDDEPADIPADVPDEKLIEDPKRFTYAIDHNGKLVLCFGDDAYVLRRPQWEPLARFLHGMSTAFAEGLR